MKWKVDENKELPVAVIEDTEDGFGICELDCGGTASHEELEKTARLIAAAPDLLAACKEALITIKEVLSQHMEHDASGRRQKLPIEKMLESAIKKAK